MKGIFVGGNHIHIICWKRKVREGERGDSANMSEIGWTFLRVTIYSRVAKECKRRRTWRLGKYE